MESVFSLGIGCVFEGKAIVVDDWKMMVIGVLLHVVTENDDELDFFFYLSVKGFDVFHEAMVIVYNILHTWVFIG